MGKKYLLDSNICVYLLRNERGISDYLRKVKWENCCISEITVIELFYGAECSKAVEANKQEVRQLCADLEVIPVSVAIEEFARQKARLRKEGTLIDDFDLLIGCTAKVAHCTLVTENVKHLERVEGVVIENWRGER